MTRFRKGKKANYHYGSKMLNKKIILQNTSFMLLKVTDIFGKGNQFMRRACHTSPSVNINHAARTIVRVTVYKNKQCCSLRCTANYLRFDSDK